MVITLAYGAEAKTEICDVLFQTRSCVFDIALNVLLLLLLLAWLVAVVARILDDGDPARMVTDRSKQLTRLHSFTAHSTQ